MPGYVTLVSNSTTTNNKILSENVQLKIYDYLVFFYKDKTHYNYSKGVSQLTIMSKQVSKVKQHLIDELDSAAAETVNSKWPKMDTTGKNSKKGKAVDMHLLKNRKQHQQKVLNKGSTKQRANGKNNNVVPTSELTKNDSTRSKSNVQSQTTALKVIPIIQTKQRN